MKKLIILPLLFILVGCGMTNEEAIEKKNSCLEMWFETKVHDDIIFWIYVYCD